MNRFFFASESPRPLALMRVLLGLVLLCESAARWPRSIELYSSAGRPMPVFAAAEPLAFGPDVTVAAQTLLVLASAAVMVGWRTRLSLIAAAVLLTWLGSLDSPGTFKKYSVIQVHLAVLTACASSGSVASLDAWRRDPTAAVRLSPRWPRRLIQFLVCAIYLGAAATKVRLAEFVSGDLLEFALLDDLWGGRPLGRSLAGDGTLLQAGAAATLAFEFLFPVLVWIPKLRRPTLALAVAFHLSLHALLHLGTFSWVMLCGLIAFLDESDLRKVRIPRFWPTPSIPAEPRPFRFAPPLRDTIAVAALVLGGVWVQHALDWYGVFGRTPRGTYDEIPRDELDEILAAQLPAYPDYVRRLELGEGVANFRTMGESRNFAPGTTVHALARFVRRRPRMNVAWLLVDSEGREAARIAKTLEVDVSHATAGFDLPDGAPAGRYRVVLQLDGVDAAEKVFDVTRTTRH